MKIALMGRNTDVAGVVEIDTSDDNRIVLWTEQGSDAQRILTEYFNVGGGVHEFYEYEKPRLFLEIDEVFRPSCFGEKGQWTGFRCQKYECKPLYLNT